MLASLGLISRKKQFFEVSNIFGMLRLTDIRGPGFSARLCSRSGNGKSFAELVGTTTNGRGAAGTLAAEKSGSPLGNGSNDPWKQGHGVLESWSRGYVTQRFSEKRYLQISIFWISQLFPKACNVRKYCLEWLISLFSLNLELRLKDGQVSNVQVEVSFLRRVRLGLESLSVFHAKPRKLLQIYHFCRSRSSASIRIFRGITNPSAVRAAWKT